MPRNSDIHFGLVALGYILVEQMDFTPNTETGVFECFAVYDEYFDANSRIVINEFGIFEVYEEPAYYQIWQDSDGRIYSRQV